MADKLMVVAHPDDEIVFGGAHLLRSKNWKVICVTNAGHRVRRGEFEAVMRRVGAEFEIWNYRDTYSLHFDTAGLKRDLRQLLRRESFELVVTHGSAGEYGHPQHKAIAKIVAGLVRHNLYVFSIGDTTLPQPILRKKRELLAMYKTQSKTLRELCRDDRLDLYITNERLRQIK